MKYHQDLAAWAANQAALMRAGRLGELDIENLIEEMEAMSRKEHRELLNRMAILIAHLLKWTYQPSHRTPSWSNTIFNQRVGIADLLEDSPSLKTHFDDAQWLQKAWARAVKTTQNETGLKDFPSTPVWSLDDILQRDFQAD